MSRPMRKLGTEIHHHMAISNASLRQPILTRQYMALASFPGFATTKSLFYDHELWYRDDSLRLYFDKFNLVLATEFVQVVIAPLFTPHACFHLQMLKDYIAHAHQRLRCVAREPTVGIAVLAGYRP